MGRQTLGEIFPSRNRSGRTSGASEGARDTGAGRFGPTVSDGATLEFEDGHEPADGVDGHQLEGFGECGAIEPGFRRTVRHASQDLETERFDAR